MKLIFITKASFSYQIGTCLQFLFIPHSFETYYVLDLPLRGSELSDKNGDRVRCTKVLGDVGRRGLSYTRGDARRRCRWSDLRAEP